MSGMITDLHYQWYEENQKSIQKFIIFAVSGYNFIIKKTIVFFLTSAIGSVEMGPGLFVRDQGFIM